VLFLKQKGAGIYIVLARTVTRIHWLYRLSSLHSEKHKHLWFGHVHELLLHAVIEG